MTRDRDALNISNIGEQPAHSISFRLTTLKCRRDRTFDSLSSSVFQPEGLRSTCQHITVCIPVTCHTLVQEDYTSAVQYNLLITFALLQGMDRTDNQAYCSCSGSISWPNLFWIENSAFSSSTCLLTRSAALRSASSALSGMRLSKTHLLPKAEMSSVNAM